MVLLSLTILDPLYQRCKEETMTKQNLIRNEHTLPWESWPDEATRQISPAVWKTLISKGKTDSYGLTMGVMEIPVGETLTQHQHLQEEAYYILAGRGQLQLAEEIYEVEAGMAAFIPANIRHAITNSADTVLKVLYVFLTDSFEEVVYVMDNES